MTAYLADIFHHLNKLNLAVQGKNEYNKTIQETEIFHQQTASLELLPSGGNLANLPFLDEIIVKSGASFQGKVQLEIVTCMKSLSISFDITFFPVN